MSSDRPQINTTTDRVSLIVQGCGFARFGFALLEKPFSIEFYDQWLRDGYHGEMQYLARHAREKREPTRLLAQAKTAIVVAVDYFPHPAPLAPVMGLEATQVALYARGEDYHVFLQKKLRDVCDALAVAFPQAQFRAFTDSSPVLERDLAARAGLGWVGKNTCLIDRKSGSLFFLGEIYTDLVIETAALSREQIEQDFCGTCTRCIDVCPTEALLPNRTLDARRCISYLTIESRKVPPLELRQKIGNWFFGCDLCQTVCPWNQKRFSDLRSNPEPPEAQLIKDFQFILAAGSRELERHFRGTPLARAGAFGLKRNALVVSGNLGLKALLPEVERLIDHPKLGELALWTKTKLVY